MKLFISADIEGVTGVVDWEETEHGKEGNVHFRNQMTREVSSACEAAVEAGFEEILVKDAHGPARNIDPSKLPQVVKILRGWTRDPYMMMGGLDKTFDGAIFIGYHSPAGTNGNPLAHTMSGNNEYVKINGEFASEFLINAYTAAMCKVPVLFLSGDKMLCEGASKLNENIKTVPVSEGIGNGSISIHPDLAVNRIKERVLEVLKDDLSKYLVTLPEKFHIEISFKNHFVAYKNGFYPGARHTGAKTIEFESSNYMDVLKFLFFVL
jgi:D-amino peptidase